MDRLSRVMAVGSLALVLGSGPHRFRLPEYAERGSARKALLDNRRTTADRWVQLGSPSQHGGWPRTVRQWIESGRHKPRWQSIVLRFEWHGSKLGTPAPNPGNYGAPTPNSYGPVGSAGTGP